MGSGDNRMVIGREPTHNSDGDNENQTCEETQLLSSEPVCDRRLDRRLQTGSERAE